MFVSKTEPCTQLSRSIPSHSSQKRNKPRIQFLLVFGLFFLLFAGGDAFGQLTFSGWQIGGNTGNGNNTYFLSTSQGGGVTPNIKLQAGSGNYLFAQANGNLGIGTSNPYSNTGLTISKNSGSALIAEQTTTNNYSYGIMVKAASSLTKSLAVKGPGGTDNFLVYADGKVFARDVEVTLGAYNHPDYVFESGYPLLSLEELKTYLEQNKHLPGIPSAAEVASKGSMSVGTMQQQLLEKVEELSLYVIQLNDELQATQKQLAKLKANQNK